MRSKSESEHAKKIFTILKKEYPSVKPALNYSNPFQLLVATILSAQCTDARVNIVGETLFKKYKTPADFLKVTNEELENDIHSTGFYHQKAKSIKESSKVLIEKYKGKVPADFNALVGLPGVGRKTASVVAGNAFGIPAVAVDTHVKRLSNLLGFIKSNNPDAIEMKIKEILPESDWTNSSHYLASHGRKICIARKPHCLQCCLADECPSFNPEFK
ncbi:MAG TPA: endonuclease III [Ignavibacteriaceae bacterium]|nr:endonuclease III [Ignavibacteriaceae bacterium]